jgi:hypothetical protein
MHAATGFSIVVLAVCTAIFASREAVGQAAFQFLGSAVTVEEHTAEVAVRLRRDIADAFRSAAGRQNIAGAAEVRAVLSSFGVELKPLSAAVSDPELGSYFTITGLSLSQAERLAAQLRELGAVEAAYVQPFPSPA